MQTCVNELGKAQRHERPVVLPERLLTSLESLDARLFDLMGKEAEWAPRLARKRRWRVHPRFQLPILRAQGFTCEVCNRRLCCT